MKSEKKILNFKKGDIIYGKGDDCLGTDNSIFLIKSGAVCMTYENDINNIIIVLEKDDMFGAEESFCVRKRMFNIIVLSDLEVEAWTRENFIIEINLSINYARAAIIQLIKKLRMINSRKKFYFENFNAASSGQAGKQNSINMQIVDGVTATENSKNKKNNEYEKENENLDDSVAESIYNFAFYDREPESIMNIFKHIGVAHKKGDVIIRENDEDNCAFLIISGALKIYHTFDGKTEILGSAGPGDFIGEMNLFHKNKRSASVEVESDTLKALRFDKNSFDMLFQLHPKWGIKLIENLSKKIVRVIKKLF